MEALSATGSTLVSGRGIVFGTALEVALELEETCLEPVRGLSYADLRQGPIVAVDTATIAFLVSAAGDPLVPGMAELATTSPRSRARTIDIGGDAAFADRAGVWLCRLSWWWR